MLETENSCDFVVFAMLLPLNWLRQESRFDRHYFDVLFSLEVMHIFMHLLLFGNVIRSAYYIFICGYLVELEQIFDIIGQNR